MPEYGKMVLVNYVKHKMRTKKKDISILPNKLKKRNT